MTINHKLRLNQIIDMYSSFPEPIIMLLSGDMVNYCIGWEDNEEMLMRRRLETFNNLMKQVREEIINDQIEFAKTKGWLPT
jgi:hypothetical protein